MSKKVTNIIREVRAEDLKEEITQDASKRLLPLCNARILGPLILKHHTIKKPIEIRNCEFAGEVDLRYCEFEQVVNFSGCTFQQKFNSGDEIESHTVYKKDLICNDTTFDETVTAQFNGVRIEGSAYFRGGRFLKPKAALDPKVALDFTGGSVEKSLECDGAAFKGPANFGALKCNGYGSFDEATFAEEANFYLASFGSHGSFDRATFAEEADFSSSSFGSYGSFDGATFAEETNFSSSSFGSYGSFDGATFEKKANFVLSSFGSYVTCSETVFKGPVTFNTVKCNGAGFFKKAQFQLQSAKEVVEEVVTEEKVDFIRASFGGNVEFQGTTFERSVTFESLACKGDGIFFNTNEFGKFKAKEIDLSYASFGGGLLFDGATVEGEAKFQRLKCDGVGRFDNALFGRFIEEYQILLRDGKRLSLVGEKVDLSFTQFGSLSLENARFGGEVDMSAARISQDLTLGGTDAQFEQEVKLYDVSMGELKLNVSMEELEQLKLKGPRLLFKRGLDLRRCQFNDFNACSSSSDPDRNPEQVALKFAKAQRPAVFSRDPYLQLEESYNRIGDLVQAKRVYYEGRCDFRRHAKYQHQRPKATKGLDWLSQWLRIKLTSWGDGLLKVLTGYGVQTERLLVPIFVALLVGFLWFSIPSNALKVAEPTSSAASAELSRKMATPTPSSEEDRSESGKARQAKGSKIQRAGFIDSVAYNLDLFLPVDLGVADKWEPQGQLREIYVFVHSLLGWLLIPLLIATLGGIIRRQ